MCCGASRAIGLRPQAAILLGEDDGSAARYVRVNDPDLIPNYSTGAQLYVKGSGVQPAIEEGKLIDVSATTLQSGGNMFRVTTPDGQQYDFTSYASARSYSVTNGGRIEIVPKEDSNA